MKNKEKETPELKVEEHKILYNAMESVDTVLAGLSSKYGGSIAASALTDHFVLLMKMLRQANNTDQLKEVMGGLQTEFEKINIKMDYEVKCCPKKKKKE